MKWSKDAEDAAIALAKQGAPDGLVAWKLGVHITTLSRWKRNHPGFSSALFHARCQAPKQTPPPGSRPVRSQGKCTMIFAAPGSAEEKLLDDAQAELMERINE